MKLKLPLEHKTESRDKKMSSVSDANGLLLAGSFIIQQSNPETVEFHKIAVKAVNEHAALVAVAEALTLVFSDTKARFSIVHKGEPLMNIVRNSLAALAAVRAGSEVAQ